MATALQLAADEPTPATATFAVGDVVRLNSDAVRMTIHAIKGEAIVCRWHDAEDDLLTEDFDRRELVLVRARE